MIYVSSCAVENAESVEAGKPIENYYRNTERRQWWSVSGSSSRDRNALEIELT